MRTNRVLDLAGGRLTNAGDLVQSAGGRLRFDADFLGGEADRLDVSGEADRLDVSGEASLAGGFIVKPTTLAPAVATVLTASSLDAAALADATGSRVFDFAPAAVAAGEGQALTLTPSADFVQNNLTHDQGSLAGHLQGVWDGDHPGAMARGFAALADLGTANAYAAVLDRLASRQVGAIATARMESSRLFVDNMQSCPVFVGASLALDETDCVWGRAVAAHLDHDGGDAAGFDTDATLVQFGGQRRIGDSLFVSGSVGWENASLRDDYGASADCESWMAGVGLKHQSGPLLASATLGFGFGGFDTTRSFAMGGERHRAKGSPDVRNAGLHGRVAHELPYKSFYLRPRVDLDASWISLDGYDESGAGDFDLAVDESDAGSSPPRLRSSSAAASISSAARRSSPSATSACASSPATIGRSTRASGAPRTTPAASPPKWRTRTRSSRSARASRWRPGATST